MHKYFVYIYFDPRRKIQYIIDGQNFEFEPFYVGKGQGERHLCHLKEAYGFYDSKDVSINPFKCRKIRKIKDITGKDPLIVIFKYFENELEALQYETFLIRSIGKIIDKTGPLVNLCDGSGCESGEKHSCFIHLTSEQKEKIRSLYVDKQMYMCDIAQIMEIGEIKVKRILEELGVEFRVREPINKISISEERYEQIKEMYSQGDSIRTISNKTKLPFERIRKIILDNGLTRYEKIFKMTSARRQHYDNLKLMAGSNSKSYIELSLEQESQLIDLFCNKKMKILTISKIMNFSTGKLTKELVRLGLFTVKPLSKPRKSKNSP